MTALDRSQAVLGAIVATLVADPDLSALVGRRVYDVPPGRGTVPSITVRLVSAADRSTADTEAQSLAFDLDVWDAYALGADLAGPRAIMAHVRRLLHMQPIAPDGCRVVLLRCMGSRGPFRDPDTVSLHGVVSVTALAGHEAAPA